MHGDCGFPVDLQRRNANFDSESDQPVSMCFANLLAIQLSLICRFRCRFITESLVDRKCKWSGGSTDSQFERSCISLLSPSRTTFTSSPEHATEPTTWEGFIDGQYCKSD